MLADFARPRLRQAGANAGSISGTVTKGGTPIFGAHVVAYDPANGSMVASPLVKFG